LTFGWLLGELIRRITGHSVGKFFADTVARPLDLDFWIGLPEAEEPRVATTVMTLGASINPEFDAALAGGECEQVSAANSLGGFLAPGGCDAPGAHRAEIPAANGVTNARGLARMYGGLMDDVPGVKALQIHSRQLAQMGATESAGFDAVSLTPTRYSAGFEKAAPGRVALLGGPGLILSEPAFGHSGLGGSVGFADPDIGLSFGYTPNRHPVVGEAESARHQPLIDATYRSLGFSCSDSGKWT
jgi:CubicO group peptidase (beta-lactamase class C family)